MAPIYLDHNATTPMLPEVADAVREASLRFGANPASQHEPGRQVRRALEAARARIAEVLGAGATSRLPEAASLREANPAVSEKPPYVIFTSGGTESNNLALTGLVGRHAQGRRQGDAAPRVVISALEHPSITRTAEHLSAHGWEIDRLGADANGVVRVDQLAEFLRPETRLVSVMLASNETGVLQPVAEISAICRERGISVHTDAVQAVGKLPVSFHDLGVDALTFTAHKFHGPLGIGALVLRHEVKLAPSLHGGFQQSALRPGTESVAHAVGLLAALEAWQRDADARRERMTSLRDEFERTLLVGDAQAVVIGAAAPRLPTTSNIAFVGLDRQALVMALDLAGVACSTGSACASGSSEPSPALVAMGLPKEQISASLRFSLGASTTSADIGEACRRILGVLNRLRRE